MENQSNTQIQRDSTFVESTHNSSSRHVEDKVPEETVINIEQSENSQLGLISKTNASNRSPMMSPGRGNQYYQRFKYYSALKTGFEHLQ